MEEIKSLFKKNWPILFLAGLTIVFYFPILTGFNFLTNDLLFLHLPVKEYLFSRLQKFQLPLWDPYTLAGRPFLADPQTGIFNPFNLLILPFWQEGNLNWNFWLLEIEVIFSVFLGGVFIYWLMKYYQIGLAGRLISSLIFIFSGFITGHIIHPNIIQTVIWLPLIFLFFQRAFKEEKIKFAILAGIFLSLAILAGHSQMSYYLFLFLGAYFFYLLFSLWQKSEQIWSKKFSLLIFLFLITILIGLGLSSIQLIPNIELALNSSRMESGYSSFDFSSSYSLPPLHLLIGSFLPHFFPNTEAGAQLLGIYACCPWEYTSYLGAISLVLIILGLISKSRSLPAKQDDKGQNLNEHIRIAEAKSENTLFKGEKWFFFFIFVFSLIISLGYFTPLYYFLYRYLPGFSLFRVPARFLFFAQFAGAILAGFGLDYFLKNQSTIKKILKWGLIWFIVLITLLIYFISFQTKPFFPIQEWPKIVKEDFLIFSLSFLSTLFSLFLITLDKKIRQIASFILIIFLFFELALIGQNFRFINGHNLPSQVYSPRKELAIFKDKNLADYRVLSRPALQLNAGLIYQIPTLEGWQSLINARYNHLLETDFLYPMAEIDFNKNKKIIDLLNTRYFIFGSNKNLKIVENNQALPRAFFVKQAEILPAQKILEEIKKTDYNPQEKIYLEEEPPKLIKSKQEIIGENQVKIISYQPEKISLSIDFQNNGWLFLSEAFYPGWQAFIDGQSIKIYRANYFFKAIPVPIGTHQIEFIFNPKSLKIGFIISLFTSLIIIISLIFLYCFRTKTKQMSIY